MNPTLLKILFKIAYKLPYTEAEFPQEITDFINKIPTDPKDRKEIKVKVTMK